MRPLSFKSKVWLSISLFTASILLISFAILATVYYWFSQNSLQKDLTSSAQEIIQNQLVFQDNQLLFKRDNQDRTISAYLRDTNLSAVFFDANLHDFATYGIYQKLKTENNFDQSLNLPTLKTVYDTNTPLFTNVHYSPNEEYFTLTLPILFQDNKVGLVQLAVVAPLFSRLKNTGLYLLLPVIFLSLLISWPLAHLLVNFLFKPLENIMAAMVRARLTNLSTPLHYSGNPHDEISLFVKTYNDMLSRIALGLDRQKTFISNASHELKTPLSRAISTMDLALINLADKSYQSLPLQIRTVRNDLFNFSHLIDNLLLLSRIDSGTVALNPTTVSLKSVIDDLLNLFSADISSKKLQVKLFSLANLNVSTDPTYFKLILSNLLSNAIKYSHPGGIIKITARSHSDQVTLRIRDYGLGINRSDQAHIFDRFFRSPQVNTTAGFGVGLSLAKQLADLLQLQIKYHPAPTKGTLVFLKCLPLVN